MMTSRTFHFVGTNTFPAPDSEVSAACDREQFYDASDALEAEALLQPALDGNFLRGLAFALAVETVAALAFLSAWQAVRTLL